MPFLRLASSNKSLSPYVRWRLQYAKANRVHTKTQANPSDEVPDQSSPSPRNPELVQQAVGLFKHYLSTQLDFKGKQIETKQEID